MASRRLVLSLLLAKVATQDCTVPGSNIRALQNALTRIKARNAYQCTTNTDMSIWDLGGTPAFHNVPPFSAAVVSLLAPVYDCPWTLERSNYVSELNFDGGKWTCGLKELSDSGQPCVVYSFGSNADSLFEDHVRRTSPSCEIHIFDPNSSPPPKLEEKGYVFHKLGLCSSATKAKGAGFPCNTIRGIMRQLNHTYVDILKADVEGEEFSLMATEPWSQHALHIGQLQLEVHLWMLGPSGRFAKLDVRLPKLLQNYIQPLERAGFFLQTTEPVSYGGSGYEFSFLNVNWNPFAPREHHLGRGLYRPAMYPKDAPCPAASEGRPLKFQGKKFQGSSGRLAERVEKQKRNDV